MVKPNRDKQTNIQSTSSLLSSINFLSVVIWQTFWNQNIEKQHAYNDNLAPNTKTIKNYTEKLYTKEFLQTCIYNLLEQNTSEVCLIKSLFVKKCLLLLVYDSMAVFGESFAKRISECEILVYFVHYYFVTVWDAIEISQTHVMVDYFTSRGQRFAEANSRHRLCISFFKLTSQAVG